MRHLNSHEAQTLEVKFGKRVRNEERRPHQLTIIATTGIPSINLDVSKFRFNSQNQKDMEWQNPK